MAGGDVVNNFRNPGTESQQAFDLLRARFPDEAGDRLTIVAQASDGVEAPAVRRSMEGLYGQVAALEHVTAVESPYAGRGQVSADGTISVAVVQFDERGPSLPSELVPEIKRLAADADSDRLAVELGGDPVRFAEQQGPGGREGFGLAVAVIVLLALFGSLVAMSMPILTAVLGIGTAMALVSLVARFVEVPVFALPLAAMLGLGVGIDYALFIVTRFRSGLHDGLDVERATSAAVATAGRAVFFASLTVVISLLGMFVTQLSFVFGLALAASLTVLVTMIAALTFLPALLGFAGHNVDRFSLPFRSRSRRRDGPGFWYRWSRAVQRRPGIATVGGFAVLFMLILPASLMRLGPIDTRTSPPSSTARRAYDLITEGFGPGFNGPLVLAVELPGEPDAVALERLEDRLGEVDGVAAMTPVHVNAAGDTAVMTIFPTSGPSDEATHALVDRLRDDVIPAAVAGTDASIHIGGVTAAFIDLADVMARRLPLFIGAVVAVSFVLLMAVFRSVLVPLKAAIMNLLSVGVAYGVVVAVFQLGWFNGVLGVERTGPIPSFLPMTLFAILFGLSMDYEVFLLTRIREEYLRTGSNRRAVASGVSATAGVVTAAAAIMVTVFLSFALGDDRIIEILGVGLASAILVDAVVIRTILLPATMELLGRSNWWLPRRIDRLLPHIHVEPPRPASASPAVILD